MESNHLGKEEELIKKMVSDAYHAEGFDLKIEDKIMSKVYLSQSKLDEINALKRKAWFCLMITIICLIVYAIICTTEFTSNLNNFRSDKNSVIFISICIITASFLIFQQLIDIFLHF